MKASILRNSVGYYLLLVVSLLIISGRVSASGPLPVSYYGNYTDAQFDKANPDGTLIIPYENWTPGTTNYEWKDISPKYHSIQGLGNVAYFYEAKDNEDDPQWQYVMNDFVGRTIDLGGTLDNWFYWKDTDNRSWGLQVFGSGDDPVRVWQNAIVEGGVLNITNATRDYDSGILGAYAFDVSPLEPDIYHTIFELAIPYDISPQLRDMIWFGDPLTSGEYYSYAVPAPSTLLLLVPGLAGVIGLRRKGLLKQA
jgi:CRISPR-associated Cas5-like protein